MENNSKSETVELKRMEHLPVSMQASTAILTDGYVLLQTDVTRATRVLNCILPDGDVGGIYSCLWATDEMMLNVQ